MDSVQHEILVTQKIVGQVIENGVTERHIKEEIAERYVKRIHVSDECKRKIRSPTSPNNN